MLIIAERINTSRKYIAQAIPLGDKEFIQSEAMAQDQAGGDFIDVNAGILLGKEAEKLKWLEINLYYFRCIVSKESGQI